MIGFDYVGAIKDLTRQREDIDAALKVLGKLMGRTIGGRKPAPKLAHQDGRKAPMHYWTEERRKKFSREMKRRWKAGTYEGKGKGSK